MKHRKAALTILAALCSSLALADDFKTINGKEYKNVTVSRVEADGIVLRTKTGISKVYFTELPKDVQERFHPSPAKTVAAKTVAAQSERMPIKVFVRVLVVGAVIIITGVVVVGIVRGRYW